MSSHPGQLTPRPPGHAPLADAQTVAPTQRWRFRVHDTQADSVLLVRYGENGASCWTPMAPSPTAPGHWEATVTLIPGEQRVAYFTRQGTTYFNCGTFGLTAERCEPPAAPQPTGRPALNIQPRLSVTPA